jgi:hypothetical protein
MEAVPILKMEKSIMIRGHIIREIRSQPSRKTSCYDLPSQSAVEAAVLSHISTIRISS